MKFGTFWKNYFWGYWLPKTWLLQRIKDLVSTVTVIMSLKTVEFCRKALLSYCFIIWSHIELERVNLVRFENLGQLVNRLTVHSEYVPHNRGILQLPIQIKLTKKPKTLCYFFIVFFRIYIKVWTFCKKAWAS